MVSYNLTAGLMYRKIHEEQTLSCACMHVIRANADQLLQITLPNHVKILTTL